MSLPAYPGHVLKRGSKGKAVREVQRVLHDHYHQQIAVDGDYGAHTAGAIRRFQLHRPPLDVDGQVGQKTWHALRTLVKLDPHWRRKRGLVPGEGVGAALKWALAHNKWHEAPGRPNNADWMPGLFSKFGWRPGYSWCQYAANAILIAGGGPLVPSGYTVAVVQWARESRYGLRVVGRDDRHAGDFLYFKWPGVSHDFCDHVGVDLGPGSAYDFEGNTSPTSGGSQNNGGGWYEKSYASRHPYLVARVRPTYHD